MPRPDEPAVGNANEGSFMIEDRTTPASAAASGPASAPITQMDYARAGIVTPQMAAVAAAEGREPEAIRAAVAAGRIAIPSNIHHASLAPGGVGSTLDGVPLTTKVNVNLGISGDLADEATEWEKVAVALELGADAIMDLSNSGKTRAFRTKLIEQSPAMIGTVPMYDAIGYLEKSLIAITPEDFLEVVRAHAEDGVDFVTIHAGMNRRGIESFKETGRLTNIVSRGGSLIFAWMEATGRENPFYEYYDEVLAILHEHDVTISLGDAMRPGSGYDATDAAQIAELVELGKLTRRAWDAGVQVMVEGPGHMALDEIAAKLQEQKEQYGAESYGVLSPQFYAVLGSLGRRFLNVHGSPNYLHSAICNSQRMFSRLVTLGGPEHAKATDTAPGQLDKCKLLVVWGYNSENSAINQGNPNKRLDSQEGGMTVIDIRPMQEGLGSHADYWLPVIPGTDGALALAFLNVIIGEDLYDHDFVENWCLGFDELAEHVKQFPPSWAAPITGIPEERIVELAGLIETLGSDKAFVYDSASFKYGRIYQARHQIGSVSPADTDAGFVWL